jgi:hypothetical protein
VALFGTLLLTTASTLFLVEHQSSTATQGETEAEASQSTEAGDPSMEAHFTLYALWTASVSLSAVIFSMTCIALLNSPLDPPKTLVINSRLLRMAPRVFVIAVLICLPLFPALSGGSWCGAATCTLYAEFLWEWIVGLERDWTFVEPKVDE